VAGIGAFSTTASANTEGSSSPPETDISLQSDTPSGDDALSVDIAESITRGDEASLTLSSPDAEHLRVTGDTEGWTIIEMEPIASLIGNPTTENDLPYESANEPWYYADATLDELTIDLEATVPSGVYEFTAEERNVDDEVVAEQSFTVEVTVPEVNVSLSNETFGPGGATTITLESDGADHLRIEGDTEGWTITEMQPTASLIGTPTTEDGFPYESDDEPWYYAEDVLSELVVELEATVNEGTYEFVAQRRDQDDAIVSEETFIIDVEEPNYNEWPVDEQQASAIDDDATGDPSLGEIKDGVDDWLDDGRINGEEYTLSELREIVDFWAS
jgi:hypothetical protein